MNNNKLPLFCDTCNCLVETNVEFQKSYPHDLTDEVLSDMLEYSEIHGIIYYFSLCPKCHSVFLSKEEFCEVIGEYSSVTSPLIKLYPFDTEMKTDGVPEKVLKSYLDAVKAYKAALIEPSLIMCRKCIEAICYENHASGRNLKERIFFLKEKEIIDTKLYTWAEMLRIVGNDAAHEFDIEFTMEDVRDTVEFTKSFIEYHYILSTRFTQFKARRVIK